MYKAHLWHSELTGNWVLDIKSKVTGKIMQRFIIGNTRTARVPKEKRQTLKQIIERSKRAERDARLVQIITR